MRFLRDFDVRVRLMILIATAMLPLIGLIAAGLTVSYSDADVEAKRAMSNQAQLGAARLSGIFEQAEGFLSALRHMSQLNDIQQPACDSLLAGLKASRPQFHTIGVISPDGVIQCHSKGIKGSVFGDRRLTQRAVAARGPQFVVGDFMVGPISGKPTVAVAMRLLPRADGKPAGAVFASLNLSLIEKDIEDIAGANGRSAMIIQPRTSRILVNWPHVTDFGATVGNFPLLGETLRQFEGGTFETHDLLGHPQIYGFQPIDGARTAGLVLAVGVAPESVFATVEWRMRWALAMGAVVLVAALCGAAFLAYWMQLRPIALLSESARRIGAGDFGTRTGMHSWQAPEFRRLGSLLDAAAEALGNAKAAELAVAASERRFRLVADNTADMISCIDPAGLRTLVTGASRSLLGYAPEELIGRSPVEITLPEDREVVEGVVRDIQARRNIRGVRYRVRRRDGTAIWVEISGQPMADDNGFVLSMRDVDERQRMEEELAQTSRQLERLADTDELTHLANRRSFNRHLRQAFERSGESEGDLSLLLIDVDRFKAFNDRYGHPAGDRCLEAIAKAVGGSIRHGDEIGARYGGEEMAVVLPAVPLAEALARGEALRRAVLALRILHEDSEAGVVSISIGVASRRAFGGIATSEDLLQRADQALYEAKSGGRNQVRTRAA
ncbi:diguanylate cyclase [Aureimonas sp. ME7]|uniref:diguanylate cyclase n=1 Tax=Aureimonas sp. ME7 TaxID=2744252 RepID=UPI0015F4E059|nr:diguanylate cyclase [Aureimonas sp. ME7]